MSACPLLTFNNVDAAGWGRIKAVAAQQYSITVTGNNGAASGAGFTIEWSYGFGMDMLTLQCLASPFLVPCDAINAHLTAAVNSALAG